MVCLPLFCEKKRIIRKFTKKKKSSAQNGYSDTVIIHYCAHRSELCPQNRLTTALQYYMCYNIASDIFLRPLLQRVARSEQSCKNNRKTKTRPSLSLSLRAHGILAGKSTLSALNYRSHNGRIDIIV